MVKAYIRNFAKAVPLAFGLVLTAICANLAMSSDKDDFVGAVLAGLIGIPLAVASTMAFLPKSDP